ncbi:hypothetical protein [Hugenholtzia roseola]|uniref:hypothetical protein n=1 Tax=Hugenholtzia roseola TaxID=1002 RepID=UPI00040F5D74|nr:hypothetical protein [Hugenholtzia roseola]
MRLTPFWEQAQIIFGFNLRYLLATSMENDLNFLPFLYQGDMLFFQRLEPTQKEQQETTQNASSEPIAPSPESSVPSSLSEEKAAVPAPKVEPKELVFRFVGKNQKQILVLLEDEESAQMLLSPTHQSFLENVLGAGGVSLADVAILNLKSQSLPEPRLFWASVRKQFAPRYIWVVGNLMPILGLPAAKLYLPTEYKDLVFLVSDPFEALEQDRQKKFALWQALKTLPFYQG